MQTGILEETSEYFKSIQHSFEETHSVEVKSRKNAAETFVIIAFVFSLVPLIPYAISLLLIKVVVKPISFGVLGLQASVSSLRFLWLLCFLLSLLTLFAYYKYRGPGKKLKARLLSAPNMRFGYTFGALDEIRHYQTNRRAQHLTKAADYLGELERHLGRLIPAAYVAWLTMELGRRK
jgi:hypothetical protein